MMTGDGSAIGSKHGISFVGKWVWTMKNYIDTSFMNLLDPKYLFNDFVTHGTMEQPVGIEEFEIAYKQQN